MNSHLCAKRNYVCVCLPLSPRLTSAKPRQLVNQCVKAVCVPANALRDAMSGCKLGMPFPAAVSIKVTQEWPWDISRQRLYKNKDMAQQCLT